MLNDLVSIIIPAYNAEKQIADSLASVLKQTYSNFEVIVVDDASRDRTTNVVRSFTDQRIRLICHSTNQGPGAARNTAIEAAEGKWIALLDADDQWHFSRLEKLIEVMSEAGEGFFAADNSLLCFETAEGLKQWGNLFELHYKIEFDGEIIELILADYLRLHSPLIQPIIPLTHIRSHSLKHNPSCYMGEDLEFYCHLFRTGLKLKLMPEPLYIYRMKPHSLSTSNKRWEHLAGVYQRLSGDKRFSNNELKLFQERLQEIKKKKQYEPFVNSLKEKNFTAAWQLLKGEPWMCFEFMRRLPKSLRYRAAALKLGGKVK
jgi:succinoglycan biosynthesis protein ExoO